MNIRYKAIGWPEARVARLRELLEGGASARQAAAVLGCTRSAVIGLASRKNIPFRNARKNVLPAIRVAQAPKPAPRRAAARICGPEAIGPLGDFVKGGCKWIHGDVASGAWRCCGHAAEPGLSWCAHHAGRVVCTMVYTNKTEERHEYA